MNVIKKKAEKSYKELLSQIEGLLGNKTTNTLQLNKLGKILFGEKYVGTFPFDKVPKSLKNGKYIIVNLDNSDQAGSHWIALAGGKHVVYSYDSYGNRHEKHVKKMDIGDIVMTEPDREQSMTQKNCGARSMTWLVVYDSFGPRYAHWV